MIFIITLILIAAATWFIVFYTHFSFKIKNRDDQIEKLLTETESIHSQYMGLLATIEKSKPKKQKKSKKTKL